MSIHRTIVVFFPLSLRVRTEGGGRVEVQGQTGKHPLHSYKSQKYRPLSHIIRQIQATFPSETRPVFPSRYRVGYWKNY